MVKLLGPAACAAALFLQGAAASAAQFVVLESQGTAGKTLPPGTVVDDAALDVPVGGQVTIMGSDGQSVQVNGPHQGSIGQVAKADDSVLTKVSQAMKDRSAVFGAARGPTDFPPPKEAGKDDPYSVDATVGGTACVFSGHKPTLWKPGTPAVAEVTIHDQTTNKDSKFAWPASQTTAPWPTDLPITGGDRYLVTVADKHRTITLKQVESGASVGASFIAAANAGCSSQAKQLAKLVKPARVVPAS